jgi:hypothetical protein
MFNHPSQFFPQRTPYLPTTYLARVRCWFQGGRGGSATLLAESALDRPRTHDTPPTHSILNELAAIMADNKHPRIRAEVQLSAIAGLKFGISETHSWVAQISVSCLTIKSCIRLCQASFLHCCHGSLPGAAALSRSRPRKPRCAQVCVCVPAQSRSDLIRPTWLETNTFAASQFKDLRIRLRWRGRLASALFPIVRGLLGIRTRSGWRSG